MTSPKKKRLKAVLAIVFILALVSYTAGLFVDTVVLGPPKTVAVIPIDGEIVGGSSSSGGLLSQGSAGVTPSDVDSLLNEALDDKSIVAIVLDIRSPGGETPPAEVMVRLIEHASAKKPVVSFISDYGASGGYWIAVSANKTMVTPLALTGSIGVISESYNAAQFMEKYGFGHQVVKSGKYKDMGSISRNLTDEEVALLQNMSDEVYYSFTNYVARKRGMNMSYLEPLAQGQLFLGRQAKELGLVDEVGYFDDAVRLAGSLAGVSEPDYRVIRIKQSLEAILEKLGLSAFSKVIGGGGWSIPSAFVPALFTPPETAVSTSQPAQYIA